MDGDLLFMDRVVFTMDGPLMAIGTTRGSIDFLEGKSLLRRGNVSPRLKKERADEIKTLEKEFAVYECTNRGGVENNSRQWIISSGLFDGFFKSSMSS